MDFKYSPYTVFNKSRTPYGLYARAHWMGESSVKLKGAVERLVASICRSQRKNGSWGDSVVKTTENLHILSLLAPHRVDFGSKAVDWLLEKEHPSIVHVSGDGSPYSGLFFKVGREDTKGIYGRNDILFNKGCSGFFKTGAALYFSGFYGREKDQRVANAFKSLDKVLNVRRGKWCSLSCSNNILRGYVSHPKKRDSSQIRKALRYLEGIQTKGGGWKETPYFYRTFNSIASSSLPAARRQVERAMPRILRSQNRDGTWGKSHKEFKTFLVLDGLHQQNIA
jgi:hypothetical protein